MKGNKSNTIKKIIFLIVLLGLMMTVFTACGDNTLFKAKTETVVNRETEIDGTGMTMDKATIIDKATNSIQNLSDDIDNADYYHLDLFFDFYNVNEDREFSITLKANIDNENDHNNEVFFEYFDEDAYAMMVGFYLTNGNMYTNIQGAMKKYNNVADSQVYSAVFEAIKILNLLTVIQNLSNDTSTAMLNTYLEAMVTGDNHTYVRNDAVEGIAETILLEDSDLGILGTFLANGPDSNGLINKVLRRLGDKLDKIIEPILGIAPSSLQTLQINTLDGDLQFYIVDDTLQGLVLDLYGNRTMDKVPCDFTLYSEMYFYLEKRDIDFDENLFKLFNDFNPYAHEFEGELEIPVLNLVLSAEVKLDLSPKDNSKNRVFAEFRSIYTNELMLGIYYFNGYSYVNAQGLMNEFGGINLEDLGFPQVKNDDLNITNVINYCLDYVASIFTTTAQQLMDGQVGDNMMTDLLDVALERIFYIDDENPENQGWFFMQIDAPLILEITDMTMDQVVKMVSQSLGVNVELAASIFGKNTDEIAESMSILFGYHLKWGTVALYVYDYSNTEIKYNNRGEIDKITEWLGPVKTVTNYTYTNVTNPDTGEVTRVSSQTVTRYLIPDDDGAFLNKDHLIVGMTLTPVALGVVPEFVEMDFSEYKDFDNAEYLTVDASGRMFLKNNENIDLSSFCGVFIGDETGINTPFVLESDNTAIDIVFKADEAVDWEELYLFMELRNQRGQLLLGLYADGSTDTDGNPLFLVDMTEFFNIPKFKIKQSMVMENLNKYSGNTGNDQIDNFDATTFLRAFMDDATFEFEAEKIVLTTGSSTLRDLLRLEEFYAVMELDIGFKQRLNLEELGIRSEDFGVYTVSDLGNKTVSSIYSITYRDGVIVEAESANLYKNVSVSFKYTGETINRQFLLNYNQEEVTPIAGKSDYAIQITLFNTYKTFHINVTTSEGTRLVTSLDLSKAPNGAALNNRATVYKYDTDRARLFTYNNEYYYYFDTNGIRRTYIYDGTGTINTLQAQFADNIIVFDPYVTYTHLLNSSISTPIWQSIFVNYVDKDDVASKGSQGVAFNIDPNDVSIAGKDPGYYTATVGQYSFAALEFNVLIRVENRTIKPISDVNGNELYIGSDPVVATITVDPYEWLLNPEIQINQGVLVEFAKKVIVGKDVSDNYIYEWKQTSTIDLTSKTINWQFESEKITINGTTIDAYATPVELSGRRIYLRIIVPQRIIDYVSITEEESYVGTQDTRTYQQPNSFTVDVLLGNYVLPSSSSQIKIYFKNCATPLELPAGYLFNWLTEGTISAFRPEEGFDDGIDERGVFENPYGEGVYAIKTPKQLMYDAMGQEDYRNEYPSGYSNLNGYGSSLNVYFDFDFSDIAVSGRALAAQRARVAIKIPAKTVVNAGTTDGSTVYLTESNATATAQKYDFIVFGEKTVEEIVQDPRSWNPGVFSIDPLKVSTVNLPTRITVVFYATGENFSDEKQYDFTSYNTSKWTAATYDVVWDNVEIVQVTVDERRYLITCHVGNDLIEGVTKVGETYYMDVNGTSTELSLKAGTTDIYGYMAEGDWIEVGRIFTEGATIPIRIIVHNLSGMPDGIYLTPDKNTANYISGGENDWVIDPYNVHNAPTSVYLTFENEFRTNEGILVSEGGTPLLYNVTWSFPENSGVLITQEGVTRKIYPYSGASFTATASTGPEAKTDNIMMDILVTERIWNNGYIKVSLDSTEDYLFLRNPYGLTMIPTLKSDNTTENDFTYSDFDIGVNVSGSIYVRFEISPEEVVYYNGTLIDIGGGQMVTPYNAYGTGGLGVEWLNKADYFDFSNLAVQSGYDYATLINQKVVAGEITEGEPGYYYKNGLLYASVEAGEYYFYLNGQLSGSERYVSEGVTQKQQINIRIQLEEKIGTESNWTTMQTYVNNQPNSPTYNNSLNVDGGVYIQGVDTNGVITSDTVYMFIPSITEVGVRAFSETEGYANSSKYGYLIRRLFGLDQDFTTVSGAPISITFSDASTGAYAPYIFAPSNFFSNMTNAITPAAKISQAYAVGGGYGTLAFFTDLASVCSNTERLKLQVALTNGVAGLSETITVYLFVNDNQATSTVYRQEILPYNEDGTARGSVTLPSTLDVSFSNGTSKVYANVTWRLTGWPGIFTDEEISASPNLSAFKDKLGQYIYLSVIPQEAVTYKEARYTFESCSLEDRKYTLYVDIIGFDIGTKYYAITSVDKDSELNSSGRTVDKITGEPYTHNANEQYDIESGVISVDNIYAIATGAIRTSNYKGFDAKLLPKVIYVNRSEITGNPLHAGYYNYFALDWQLKFGTDFFTAITSRGLAYTIEAFGETYAYEYLDAEQTKLLIATATILGSGNQKINLYLEVPAIEVTDIQTENGEINWEGETAKIVLDPYTSGFNGNYYLPATPTISFGSGESNQFNIGDIVYTLEWLSNSFTIENVPYYYEGQMYDIVSAQLVTVPIGSSHQALQPNTTLIIKAELPDEKIINFTLRVVERKLKSINIEGAVPVYVNDLSSATTYTYSNKYYIDPYSGEQFFRVPENINVVFETEEEGYGPLDLGVLWYGQSYNSTLQSSFENWAWTNNNMRYLGNGSAGNTFTTVLTGFGVGDQNITITVYVLDRSLSSSEIGTGYRIYDNNDTDKADSIPYGAEMLTDSFLDAGVTKTFYTYNYADPFKGMVSDIPAILKSSGFRGNESLPLGGSRIAYSMLPYDTAFSGDLEYLNISWNNTSYNSSGLLNSDITYDGFTQARKVVGYVGGTRAGQKIEIFVSADTWIFYTQTIGSTTKSPFNIFESEQYYNYINLTAPASITVSKITDPKLPIYDMLLAKFKDTTNSTEENTVIKQKFFFALDSQGNSVFKKNHNKSEDPLYPYYVQYFGEIGYYYNPAYEVSDDNEYETPYFIMIDDATLTTRMSALLTRAGFTPSGEDYMLGVDTYTFREAMEYMGYYYFEDSYHDRYGNTYDSDRCLGDFYSIYWDYTAVQNAIISTKYNGLVSLGNISKAKINGNALYVTYSEVITQLDFGFGYGQSSNAILVVDPLDPVFPTSVQAKARYTSDGNSVEMTIGYVNVLWTDLQKSVVGWDENPVRDEIITIVAGDGTTSSFTIRLAFLDRRVTGYTQVFAADSTLDTVSCFVSYEDSGENRAIITVDPMLQSLTNVMPIEFTVQYKSNYTVENSIDTSIGNFYASAAPENNTKLVDALNTAVSKFGAVKEMKEVEYIYDKPFTNEESTIIAKVTAYNEYKIIRAVEGSVHAYKAIMAMIAAESEPVILNDGDGYGYYFNLSYTKGGETIGFKVYVANYNDTMDVIDHTSFSYTSGGINYTVNHSLENGRHTYKVYNGTTLLSTIISADNGEFTYDYNDMHIYHNAGVENEYAYDIKRINVTSGEAEVKLLVENKEISALNIASEKVTDVAEPFYRAKTEWTIDPYNINLPSSVTITYQETLTTQIINNIVWMYKEADGTEVLAENSSYLKNPDILTGKNPEFMQVVFYTKIGADTVRVLFSIKARNIATTGVINGGNILVVRPTISGTTILSQLPQYFYYDFSVAGDRSDVTRVPIYYIWGYDSEGNFQRGGSKEDYETIGGNLDEIENILSVGTLQAMLGWASDSYNISFKIIVQSPSLKDPDGVELSSVTVPYRKEDTLYNFDYITQGLLNVSELESVSPGIYYSTQGLKYTYTFNDTSTNNSVLPRSFVLASGENATIDSWEFDFSQITTANKGRLRAYTTYSMTSIDAKLYAGYYIDGSTNSTVWTKDLKLIVPLDMYYYNVDLYKSYSCSTGVVIHQLGEIFESSNMPVITLYKNDDKSLDPLPIEAVWDFSNLNVNKSTYIGSDNYDDYLVTTTIMLGNNVILVETYVRVMRSNLPAGTIAYQTGTDTGGDPVYSSLTSSLVTYDGTVKFRQYLPTDSEADREQALLTNGIRIEPLLRADGSYAVPDYTLEIVNASTNAPELLIKDAGIYNVYITIDDYNYYGVFELTYEIKQKKLTKPDFQEAVVVYFTNSDVNPHIIAPDDLNAPENAWYNDLMSSQHDYVIIQKTDGNGATVNQIVESAIDAGTYTYTHTITSVNYETIVLESTITIKQANLKVVLSSSADYNGSYRDAPITVYVLEGESSNILVVEGQQVKVDNLSDLNITYTYHYVGVGGEYTVVSDGTDDTKRIKDAGSYMVSVAISSSLKGNYNANDTDVVRASFNINKIDLTFTVDDYLNAIYRDKNTFIAQTTTASFVGSDTLKSVFGNNSKLVVTCYEESDIGFTTPITMNEYTPVGRYISVLTVVDNSINLNAAVNYYEPSFINGLYVVSQRTGTIVLRPDSASGDDLEGGIYKFDAWYNDVLGVGLSNGTYQEGETFTVYLNAGEYGMKSMIYNVNINFIGVDSESGILTSFTTLAVHSGNVSLEDVAFDGYYSGGIETVPGNSSSVIYTALYIDGTAGNVTLVNCEFTATASSTTTYAVYGGKNGYSSTLYIGNSSISGYTNGVYLDEGHLILSSVTFGGGSYGVHFNQAANISGCTFNSYTYGIYGDIVAQTSVNSEGDTIIIKNNIFNNNVTAINLCEGTSSSSVRLTLTNENTFSSCYTKVV